MLPLGFAYKSLFSKLQAFEKLHLINVFITTANHSTQNIGEL